MFLVSALSASCVATRSVYASTGKVIHTIGWPLGWSTYGGGWEYHMADGLVSIGLVVGLDYKNPWLEPYREFQVGQARRGVCEGGRRSALASSAPQATDPHFLLT